MAWNKRTLTSFQLRDAMTLMGNTAEADQKMAGVTGQTEKDLPLSPSFQTSFL